MERVVEGDTIDLKIDLGFGITLTGDEVRVRLRWIDTAETYGVRNDTDEYALGKQHKRFVEEWVAEAGESNGRSSSKQERMMSGGNTASGLPQSFGEMMLPYIMTISSMNSAMPFVRICSKSDFNSYNYDWKTLHDV